MSGHTPGPWRLVPPPVADNGNPWRVAGGDHTVAIVPNRPREADARLIAAAPDLLKAAREAFEFVPWHNSDCDGTVEYEEGTIFDPTIGCTCYISKLRDAIYKAEGRNQ